jgi:hypothetical protein
LAQSAGPESSRGELLHLIQNFESTRSNGKQYDAWGQPYFRFPIPHSVKQGGRYIKDFHQWDALKSLAQAGYATFYATNHVLERNQLFDLAAQRRLLDSVPFLDVSVVTERHDYRHIFARFTAFYFAQRP